MRTLYAGLTVTFEPDPCAPASMAGVCEYRILSHTFDLRSNEPKRLEDDSEEEISNSMSAAEDHGNSTETISLSNSKLLQITNILRLRHFLPKLIALLERNERLACYMADAQVPRESLWKEEQKERRRKKLDAEREEKSRTRAPWMAGRRIIRKVEE